jgi:hypothetical protein
MRNTELSSIGYKILSQEDLQKHVPAAFTNHPHPDRTEKYSFISTIGLVETFAKLGWNPYSAKQHGANEFGRHIIRMDNPDLGFINVRGDQVKPHLLLDNSHDGFTPASMHLGLFRLVCTNGLVIAIPGMATQIKFRHINIDAAELLQTLAEAAEQYRTIGTHVSVMQDRILTADEREDFAIRALALREPTRFMKEGAINLAEIGKSMNPVEILTPIRPEDESNDLWTTFNPIQEKTVKGLYERKSAKGKKSSPREITNAARNLTFNKQLWSIAEEYLGAPVDALTTSEKKIFTSAKGKSMEVEVLGQAYNNQVQVKTQNGLVFTANVNQLA